MANENHKPLSAFGKIKRPLSEWKLPPGAYDKFKHAGAKPTWRGGKLMCECPDCRQIVDIVPSLAVSHGLMQGEQGDGGKGRGKKAPTLCDALLRQSFTKHWHHCDPTNMMAQKLAKARKFVLNSDMSAFMCDLANVVIGTPKEMHVRILEGTRKLARAPHALTWIEYDNVAKVERGKEYGVEPANRDHLPEKLGWLIEQHPQVETAFSALECSSHALDVNNQTIYCPQPNVVAHVWCTEDHPIPFNAAEFAPFIKKYMPNDGSVSNYPDRSGGNEWVSGVTTGITSYHSPYVGIIRGPQSQDMMNKYFEQSKYNAIAELQGDLRYLWALLATINDLPTKVEAVVASRGFVAKGRYRKFVDHSFITLNIPAKTYKKVAAKAIHAAKRRAHQVRGHWRKNWRKPGERMWIKEHERGDASLGFVLHDYKVTHENLA